MTPLWMWVCPTHWPVVPTGRILESIPAQERDEIQARASSLLDNDLRALSDRIQGIRVVLPEHNATRKSPDMRLSANVRGTIYRRRKGLNVWANR